VVQQYLPATRTSVLPAVGQGFEAEISTQVARRREAQLEALRGCGVAPAEVLTYSPTDRTYERWLQRTLGQVGEQLAAVRERIYIGSTTASSCGTRPECREWSTHKGSITPRTGGVYACTRTPTDTNALQEQASTLPELIRPVVSTTLTELPAVLAAQAPDVRF